MDETPSSRALNSSNIAVDNSPQQHYNCCIKLHQVSTTTAPSCCIKTVTTAVNGRRQHTADYQQDSTQAALLFLFKSSPTQHLNCCIKPPPNSRRLQQKNQH